MPIKQILPNGKVRLQNSNTGEIRDVDPVDLGAYNPSLISQYKSMVADTPAPTAPTTPSPVPVKPVVQQPKPVTPTPDPETQVRNDLSKGIKRNGILDFAGSLLGGAAQVAKQAGAGLGYAMQGDKAQKSTEEALKKSRELINKAQKTTDPKEKKRLLDMSRKIDQGVDVSSKEFTGAVQEELKNPVTPVSAAAKTAAGVAPALLPAGNSVKAAVGMGALGGAALGASEANTLPEIVDKGASGTIGGAAAGGLVAGAGKVISKATKGAATKIMNTVFKEPMKETRAAIKGGETLGEQALKKGEVGTTEGLYKKSISKISNLEDQLQEKLMGSDHAVSIEDINKTVKPLIDKYTQSGNTHAAEAITNRISAIQQQVGDRIPAAAANEIKRALYDEARKSYGTEASANMEGLKAIARGIKESLDNIPGVSQINKDLSYYGKTADSLIDKLARGGRNDVIGLGDLLAGSVGTAIFGPVGLAGVAAKKAMGTTIGKTATANALNKGGQAVGKVVSSAPVVKAAQLEGAALPGQLPSISKQPPTSTNYDESYQPSEGGNQQLPEIVQTDQQNIHSQTIPTASSSVNGSLPAIDTPQYVTGMSPTEHAMAYRKALAAGDSKAATQIKSLYDMETAYQKQNMPAKNKPLSSQQVKDVALAHSGLRNLITVKQELGLDEKGKTYDKMKVVEAYAPGSPGARKLRGAVNEVVDSVLRLRTGAQANPSEIKFYTDQILKPGDSFGAIMQKLQTYEDYLTEIAGQQSDMPDLPEPSSSSYQAYLPEM